MPQVSPQASVSRAITHPP
jgi:putative membrane protein